MVEDFVERISRLSVEQQKKWVQSLYYDNLFNGHEGVYFGMMRRLNQNKKLTKNQIVWIWHRQKIRQAQLTFFIPRLKKEDLEAF
ncbi:MAG: hypothetical protein QXG39_00145 [Candidatus Aenigmatarchaeota archaeon]